MPTGMTEFGRPGGAFASGVGPPYISAWFDWLCTSTASSRRASGSGAFFGAAGAIFVDGRGRSSSSSIADEDARLADEGGAPQRAHGAVDPAPSAPHAGHEDMSAIIPQGPMLLATRDMPSSKRLEFLLKITAAGKADPFAWYGLAMEYRSLAM